MTMFHLAVYDDAKQSFQQTATHLVHAATGLSVTAIVNRHTPQRAVNNTVLLQQAMSLLQHSVLLRRRLSVFSWRFSCSDCYRCRDRVHFCNTLFIRLTLSICLHFCRCSGLILGISYVRFLCIFHIAQRDCYTSNIDSRCRHTSTTCTVDPSTSLLTTA